LTLARRLTIRSKTVWLVTVVTILAVFGSIRTEIAFVTFLAVGQGDASIVRSEDGVCFAIDTGPGFASSVSIIRHAKKNGCTSLDPVIISHPHADHIGGLERMIKSGLVGSVVVAFDGDESGSRSAWRDAARSRGVPINQVSAGDILSIGRSMKLYILSPGNSPAHENSINNSSIVALLKTRHSAVLFTGDAERQQERELIFRYGTLLQADIVKVAHHGSHTSSTKSFVERVSISDGTTAIISAGLKNRFGHPSPIVVARWKNAGSTVFLTGKYGALSFVIKEGRIALRPF